MSGKKKPSVGVKESQRKPVEAHGSCKPFSASRVGACQRWAVAVAGMGHFSGCIHAGLLPQPCPPFTYAPSSQLGRVAQWCANGSSLRDPGYGVEDTASTPQCGRGRGSSLAP